LPGERQDKENMKGVRILLGIVFGVAFGALGLAILAGWLWGTLIW